MVKLLRGGHAFSRWLWHKHCDHSPAPNYVSDPLAKRDCRMNLNTQTLDNHWQEIIGKLHERWGALNEEDLRNSRGNVDQLVGTIQRRTGETKDTVQHFLEEIAQTYSGRTQQAADAIRQFAGRAAESMQGASEQASEAMRTSMKQSRDMVRQHPMESILACFGAGVVTGVVVGLLFRPR
jgi:uncharacterized protein YjbJ (UPF0337 family)